MTTTMDSVIPAHQLLDRTVTGLFGAGGAIGAAWGSAPTVVPHTGLAGFVPSASELLRTPLLRPPFLTVLVDGKVVPPARYCRADRIVNFADAEYLLDRALFESQLAAGAALKLNRMELWSPPVAALAQAIGAVCHKQVKVWGFLSPHGQKLVPSHRDPAHVVAVQLAGRKRWILGGPCPEGPWSAMDRPTAGEESTVELESGDVLYLPYGYAHCAAAETASSFHISFALEGTTAGELRHRILKYLSERLDGSDSTEVRKHNLEPILADVRATLNAVSERVADLPRRDVSDIYAGNTAQVDGLLEDDASVTR